MAQNILTKEHINRLKTISIKATFKQISALRTKERESFLPILRKIATTFKLAIYRRERKCGIEDKYTKKKSDKIHYIQLLAGTHESRAKLIKYFTKFPLQTTKHNNFVE